MCLANIDQKDFYYTQRDDTLMRVLSILKKSEPEALAYLSRSIQHLVKCHDTRNLEYLFHDAISHLDGLSFDICLILLTGTDIYKSRLKKRQDFYLLLGAKMEAIDFQYNKQKWAELSA